MVNISRDNPPPRWVVQIMLGIVAVSIVTQLFGDAIAPDLVNRTPELLIALNPRSRNLLLATNQLGDLSFYTIAFFRLILTDPVYYLLGYWFGDKALDWVRRRSRTYGPLVDDGQAFFRKAAYPIIFFSPNNIICLLSGATGMRVSVFVALNLTGTAVRLVLVRTLGEAFSSPIDRGLSFIQEYRGPLLVLSVLLVAWTIFGEFRGNDSELQSLAKMTNDGDDDNPSHGDGNTGGAGGETSEPAG